MRYKIQLLPPKKSLGKSATCNIVVKTYNTTTVGFTIGFDPLTTYDSIIEMPNDIEWAYHQTVIDGPRFTIELVYTNKKGDRSETVLPVPMVMD